MKRYLCVGLVVLVAVACCALPCFAQTGYVEWTAYFPYAEYDVGGYFDINYEQYSKRFYNEQENEIVVNIDRIDTFSATSGEWQNTVVNFSVVNTINPQASLGQKSVTYTDWNSVPYGVQFRQGGSVIEFTAPQEVDRGDTILHVYTYTEEYSLEADNTSLRSVWLVAKANKFNADEYYSGIINDLDSAKDGATDVLKKPFETLAEAGQVLNVVADGFPFAITLAVTAVGVGAIGIVMYGDKEG